VSPAERRWSGSAHSITVPEAPQAFATDPNNVFAGWISNEIQKEDIVGTYVDSTASPSTTHFDRSIFASPTGTFVAGGTAPNRVPPPVLDTGNNPGGVGGSSATLRTSRIRSRTDLAPAPGQRLIVEAVDSPSDGDPASHPTFGAAQLVRFHFGLFFYSSLCI
jgi:hypothetical protein